MNKQKNKKKVIAFLLSMLMLISLFQNISYTPIAEGGESQGVNATASATDAETGEISESNLETAEETLMDSGTSFSISDLKCYVTKD